MKDLIYIDTTGKEIEKFNLNVHYIIINTAAGLEKFKNDVHLFRRICDEVIYEPCVVYKKPHISVEASGDEEVYIPYILLQKPGILLELCKELGITASGKEIYCYDFYNITDEFNFIKDNLNWGT